MFGRRALIPTNTPFGVARLREAIDEAQTVVIGAGAGLSTSAGFEYAGERFDRYFRHRHGVGRAVPYFSPAGGLLSFRRRDPPHVRGPVPRHHAPGNVCKQGADSREPVIDSPAKKRAAVLHPRLRALLFHIFQSPSLFDFVQPIDQRCAGD